MTKPRFVRSEIAKEMIRLNDEMAKLKVGSEEYLNAAKAQMQLADATGKAKKVDINALIPGVSWVIMFIIYTAYADEHIVDSRGMNFVKNMFRR